MPTVRIVVFGSGAVGKSAITMQLVSGHFVQIYDPTLEDSYQTSINVDGEMVSLDLLDTAGSDEYSALRFQYMRTGDGYVIVYSITSITSFFEANTFRELLYRVLDKDFSEHIPIALCGNKCDLESNRQVFTEDANKVADKWKTLFYETSAKNNTNITETFQGLVRDIRANVKIDNTTSQKKTSKRNKNRCIIF
ncbi:hypothetical protein EIN_334820 [Entamoeba invadens IP1]|uniref:small monomeric GTPase n=1 Tax=Entamoeba invadens IP1 TaxID=370355 RepID=L7FNH6_ENTIV|nr:hypothetical protein EIN_334820 [Entamoeba invadens IP1]ELP88540.1 hypothetical protein EIN_334820 [Entamoeba invadens IP1]|eukprot:XP_004255311.1 hypothetical protein EIN_334820 [Entamoeba invadens IP1]